MITSHFSFTVVENVREDTFFLIKRPKIKMDVFANELLRV